VQTILVVDDEPQIVRVVRSYLEKAGYQVAIAANGRDALFTARDVKPDLVVLDLQMPEMDGLEFTRRIRAEQPEIAIIMLTARVDEMDRILGLELGADDYMTKPFSPRELVARVRAVLRRMQSGTSGSADFRGAEVLREKGLVLDRGRREVQKDGHVIDLTPTEFDLLAVLMAAPGHAFSRADLLEAVQGVAFEAYERTIDVHVKNLRQKLGDDPADPYFIGTVRGIGYRFND
jgi:DNA-binding response OmpR family regulator